MSEIADLLLPVMSLPLTEPAWIFVVLFLVILLAPLLAQRVRIPGIIGLIVAGLLIGPDAFGLVERAGVVEVLGGIGLLYLMFIAGIDLDLDGFFEHQRDSIVFGAATFVVPMIVNTAAAMFLGLEVAAAVLIASAFTSHTLVAFPMVQRFGLLKNRAVTATIGATLLSTVAALLVLAVVAALATGEPGPLFWLQFVLSLLAFLGFTLWGLPRLSRWFLAGFGQDRAVRFTYVLVVLFAVSALADLAGIEPIVGAFLAGLAMNRFIAEGSILMERVQFLGSSLFIPLFLISTGMLIDPVALVTDPRGVVLGAALSAAALGAKYLAVEPAGRILGFTWPERGLMFSLSSAQAAGALAAAIVAAEIGLIDQAVINAVILVILLTCVVAPVVAARFAPRIPRPERRVALGQRIVVPIANPRSAGPLVKIAALVAGPDGGTVMPVNVLGFDASSEQVDDHREITAEAEQVALRNGAEARSLVRVDSSPTAGVLHTVVEGDATAALIGWKGYANAREHFFGGVIDGILARITVPTMVCRPGSDDAVRRIVLSVTTGDLAPAGLPGLELAVDVAKRMAKQAEVDLLVLTEGEDKVLTDRLADVKRLELQVDSRKPTIALRARTQEGDVVVIGTPPTGPGLGQDAPRVAKAIRDRTVVVTVPRLS